MRIKFVILYVLMITYFMLFALRILGFCNVPYRQKYCPELNLEVGPKIAIARILADLNFVIRHGVTICIYVSKQ